MLSAKKIAFNYATVFLLITFAFHTTLFAQTEEMKVSDDVEALQKQLESASFTDRDEAEKQIIALGPDALDFIPDPSDKFEDDFNVRVTRIRKALEKVAIERATSPTTISLSGNMSLKSAFSSIKNQTGNSIMLAEGYDPAFLDKKIDLDHKDATFWTVFADIQARGGVQSVVYGGEPGHAIIVPAAGVDPAAVDKAVTVVPPPIDESGIFRMRVSSVSSAKNLLNPALDYTRVDLEIQWEPRLTPISIDLPMKSVKVFDVDGKELKISNPEQVLSGTVQAGVNQVEMSIALQNVDRDVKKIGEVKGQLECVLPGRREKFRFPTVGEIGDNPTISKAGILVQYLGFEENEDLFAVNIRVAMEPGTDQLESHLGWIYDNPLFLINDAGEKIQSVGRQGGAMGEDGLDLQFLFIENPTKFGLLYESPGAIVSVPAAFSLKGIPLP